MFVFIRLAMADEYYIKTDGFEGPLDLLLHLIKVHEIDIFDIDIFRLTKEYLDQLRLMRFDDLKKAGEFVEMAASLIDIKARMLLPHDEKKSEDEDVEDDPVKSLQQRLIQYEMFRNAAEHFHQMPQMGVEIQTNNEWERLDPIYEDVEAPMTGDSASLIVLYEQLLRLLVERKSSKVTAIKHRITVEEVIEKLEQEIMTARFSLFQGYYNKFQSRYELVVHILAMLQLSKDKRLKVFQQDMFGPLWVYRNDCEEAELPVNSRAEEGVHTNA